MNKITTALWASLAAVPGMAAIVVDTSPGTGAPPSTLGGYTMVAFPADPSAEGDMITSLTPPASALVVGNVEFTTPLEHMVVGPSPPHWWDTWSHGFTGHVYATTESDLLMFSLPAGTMAFSFYVQPNLKADFEFAVVSGATLAVETINGDGGAQYFGFYSDDLDPLKFVYILQTSKDSDGFAVGEFAINGVPEPQTWGLLAGLGLLGFAAYRKVKAN